MIPRALTIAGSDSGGGGGIQADLKTFCTMGVFGMSVVTAVTAQNTVRINGVVEISPEFVSLQFESVMADIGVDGVKTGMLANTAVVQVIAGKLHSSRIEYVVIDPVMVSTTGEPLLCRSSLDAVKKYLLPEAMLVTPNIPEAEILSGLNIESVEHMKAAAREIHSLGCRAVLIKGGHLKGCAIDVLYDNGLFTEFVSERIKTQNTHGTGCTYSAAILSHLIKGYSLKDSVKQSKIFITKAISNGFALGKGLRLLNHFV